MLLAIDTSTAQAGLALCHGPQLIAETIWYSDQRHTIELAPAVSELLRRSGLGMKDLDAVGVAIGPGSFTALRVGMAFAKGLAIARNVPIIGIPTLDVLAAGQPTAALRLAAVLQAGRGRLAVGWYHPAASSAERGHSVRCSAAGDWITEGAAEVMTVDALGAMIDRPTLVAGELTLEERQSLRSERINVMLAAPHLCVRRPSILAQMAEHCWRKGKVDEAGALAPIYLQLNASVPA